MSNEMNDLLGNLDDAFDAPMPSSEGFEIDAGTYIFHVKDAEICKSKSSERTHVKMTLQCLSDGPFKNALHYSYDLRFTDTTGTADAQAIGFFKLACQLMGIIPPSTSAGAAVAVGQMPGRVIQADIVVKKDFRNLRIKKLISASLTKWMEQGCPMPSDTTTNTGW